MGLFAKIYDRTLALSKHRHAERYLVGISASESIFFPIPPDVMLIPMSLAHPERAYRYALICTIASVLGGLVGYALGYFALELVMPLIQKVGYEPTFLKVKSLFAEYGFWIVFIAGFTPIPYKVFTIASGAVGMPWLAFIGGSMVGRGGRFFLVCGLIKLGGARMEKSLRQYVEWIGWTVLLVLLLAFVVVKLN